MTITDPITAGRSRSTASSPTSEAAASANTAVCSGALTVGIVTSRKSRAAVAPKPRATLSASARIRASTKRMVSVRKARTVPRSATRSGMTLYALPASKPVTLSTAPVLTFYAIFIHANIRWRFGWLEWLVATPAYRHYHDHDWGYPIADERALFEMLCLELFQSGLSWLTILQRREGFRRAFAGFDVNKVVATMVRTMEL